MLAGVQDALAQGQHAVGLFAYELGEDFHGIAARGETRALSQVLLFERCEHLSAAQVDAWLASRQAGPDARAGGPTAGIANLRANVTQAEFTDAIARIRAYIAAGDTYQVNYTYRLRFDVYGSPTALYARLRRRQPVPYGALICLPDGEAVLSLSPELFVRCEDGELLTQPMKGTAPAAPDASDADEDAARAQALAADPKNRAENLMIVDLLRNDLGRIAATGSVQVPRLFEVKRYANLLQMTSTVRAHVRPDLELSDIFAAIYPCGSITGAPKRRTMQIIRELEPAPRGWYTGAIGWFDAPSGARRIGNFCLTVPIRTLTLQAPMEGEGGLRAGEMGVGAGIVYDSEAHDEYEECRIKARFLTGLPHDFELFETMYATRDGCRHLLLHLQRLQASAAYFGFACDTASISAALREACAALPANSPRRLRLALAQDGAYKLQTAPLAPLAEPVKLLLAPQPVEIAPLFLRHKTTVRAAYDAAWQNAERQGAFDTLFCNQAGELTEGGRSSLFVKLDGHWYTPPLTAGLLSGVMRTALLADPHWQAGERTLTLADLRRAEEVVVCNALRGPLRATVVFNS